MDKSFPNNFIQGHHPQPHFDGLNDKPHIDYSCCTLLIKQFIQLCRFDEDAKLFLEFLYETQKWLNYKQNILNLTNRYNNDSKSDFETQINTLENRSIEINDTLLPPLKTKEKNLNSKLNWLTLTLTGIILTSVIGIIAFILLTSPMLLLLTITLSVAALLTEIVIFRAIDKTKDEATEVEYSLNMLTKEAQSISTELEGLRSAIDNLYNSEKLVTSCQNHYQDMKRLYNILNPMALDSTATESSLAKHSLIKPSEISSDIYSENIPQVGLSHLCST